VHWKETEGDRALLLIPICRALPQAVLGGDRAFIGVGRRPCTPPRSLSARYIGSDVGSRAGSKLAALALRPQRNTVLAQGHGNMGDLSKSNWRSKGESVG
jgi:hypothetical protein